MSESDFTSRGEKLSLADWCWICLVSGFGGMAPTVARLATIYANNPATPWPQPQLYFALLLFFLIGTVVACAVPEGRRTLRHAFVMGVAAPGIITNIVSGAADANGRRADVQDESVRVSILGRAFAQPNERAGVSDRSKPQLASEVTLTFHVVGSTGANLSVSVNVLSGANTSLLSGTTSVEHPFKTVIPPTATAIEVIGGEHRLSIPLESPIPRVLSFAINVDTKPRNDFWWALGFPRETQISGLSYNPVRAEDSARGGTPEAPRGKGSQMGSIRHVYFSNGAMVAGQLIRSEAQLPGETKVFNSATDKVARLFMVFGDLNAHAMRGELKGPDGATVRRLNYDMPSVTRADASWRYVSRSLSLEGLVPGVYTLDLIIDDGKVGAYSFTLK